MCNSTSRRSIAPFLMCSATLLCLLVDAASAGDSIHIVGAVPQPTEWTVDRLKREMATDVTEIRYTARGKDHTARGVALTALLKAAGVDLSLKMSPKADPKTKNRVLRLAIVVRSSDGYTTTLSAAELLPEIGNRHAWLAIEIDGQPLPARDTPVNLIVPEDVMPGRWVRGVETIQVIDLSEPQTTRPTADGGQ